MSDFDIEDARRRINRTERTQYTLIGFLCGCFTTAFLSILAVIMVELL